MEGNPFSFSNREQNNRRGGSWRCLKRLQRDLKPVRDMKTYGQK